MLRWLLAGRPDGPVFLTGRRAPAGSDPAHTCPVTGRARMSYRRAAEIFTGWTRPLDATGRGWTLHQLRQATAALDPACRGWTLHQLCLAGQDGSAAGPRRGDPGPPGAGQPKKTSASA